MIKVRRLLLVAALFVVAAARFAPSARSVVPDSLTNDQFWALTSALSEPGGAFRSDNLLSNERSMQHVIPSLLETVKPGAAYLGVGPEQNFTYIAALKPGMAFIVDIRRGNLQLHLMYKALFELSDSRSDFVSRLFSRTRAPGLRADASVEELFKAYGLEKGDAGLHALNLLAVRDHLIKTRGFPLSDADLQGIASISQAFFEEGPFIRYRANFGSIYGMPTYAELMTSTDANGVTRGYLGSEEAFAYVKSLHARNLIVPVVGDFAGPKALRALGAYLKERKVMVGAFYLSNVEQYLVREGRWQLFCENAASLPLDIRSTFIRSIRDVNSFGRGVNLASVTSGIRADTQGCVQ